jgi:hypothetical protein
MLTTIVKVGANRKKVIPIAAIFVAIAFSFFGFSTPAFAASPIAINQCNNSVADNVGGQGIECDVTVTNTLDEGTGATSSTTVVKTCDGAAGTALTCVTTSSSSLELVDSVTQCDVNGNGGGGTVLCNVTINNNITGAGTPDNATVNQCVGSGTGGGTDPTLNCDPFPATTTGATVTQCNGSGNDGGGTMRVTCTVGSAATISSLTPVTVDQCNGSANGGGATVTCSVAMVTTFTPASTGGGGTGGTGGTGGSTGGTGGTGGGTGGGGTGGSTGGGTGGTGGSSSSSSGSRLPITGVDSLKYWPVPASAILVGAVLLVLASGKRRDLISAPKSMFSSIE